MKRAFGFLLLLSASLTAAKVSGKWAGSMTLPDGSTIPVFLTLIEQGTAISGSIALGTDEGQVPIKKVELRGQLLTFRAPDNVFHGIAFQVTVTDRSLIGEGTLFGVQPLKVSLFPGPPPGAFRMGEGVSPPRVIHKVEPDYSKEARQAKYQGTVLLYVQVSPKGKATKVRVLRSLGLGLDEKAMEAVAKWRFQPGMKDGKPVTVEAQIEVNFRLF